MSAKIDRTSFSDLACRTKKSHWGGTDGFRHFRDTSEHRVLLRPGRSGGTKYTDVEKITEVSSRKNREGLNSTVGKTNGSELKVLYKNA